MITLLQKDLTVPEEYHNQRLDLVLAQLLPEYSRSQISNWIKSNAVTLNHKPCKPKDKASSEDRILIDVDLHTLENNLNECVAENIPLDVIFEDQEVLVLNKPAGLIVHPGAGNGKHTLVNALLYHAPELVHLPRAGIIHRLDKDTTGLLIVAKSLTAHSALIRQMQARTIQRHYLALAQGHIISGGTIDTNFGRHPKNRLKMAVTKQGRQAITHYTVNKQYKNFTLLNVKLMTGRTHQIRVHLAHIKHPLVGDQLYSGRMRFPPNVSEHLRLVLAQWKRQALHACSIAFCHPETKEELQFQAPVPNDFQLLLNIIDGRHEE